jgi:hypothetical protein
MTHRLLLTAALAALSAVAAPAQQGKPAPDAPATTDGKLAEWPALKDADKTKALALVEQFRKPETKLHEPAHKALVVVHGFIKKSQKTPKAEIEIALRRMKERSL